MASTWETGHGVNIANFRNLIERCEEFGVAYQPGNADISIEGMKAKLSAVEELQKNYIIALEATKIPINERELVFREILRTVVRVVNVYSASNASEFSIDDARSFLNKLTGRNVKVKRMEDGSREAGYVSNSQQGYVKKAENLHMLVEFLRNDVKYAPHEEVLRIESLEALLGRAKTANNLVDEKMVELIVKRTYRDHALYDAGTGLVDLALACKKYVKALFGSKSLEAKSVAEIKLRRRMRLQRAE